MISAIDWLRPTEIPTLAAPGSAAARRRRRAPQHDRDPRRARRRPGAALRGALSDARAVAQPRALVSHRRHRGRVRRATPSSAWRGSPAIRSRSTSSRHRTIASRSRTATSSCAAEIERVMLDGVAYDRDGSPARLVDDRDLRRCEIWFGDALLVACRDARSRRHAHLAGPIRSAAAPPTSSASEFPPALVAAIAELVADARPAAARPRRARARPARSLRWDDLGAARRDAHGDRARRPRRAVGADRPARARPRSPSHSPRHSRRSSRRAWQLMSRRCRQRLDAVLAWSHEGTPRNDLSLFAAAPAAADVSIVANNAKKTVDCKKHKSVNIVGNHAKVTLKGQCEKIMIAGNHAKVTGSANGVLSRRQPQRHHRRRDRRDHDSRQPEHGDLEARRLGRRAGDLGTGQREQGQQEVSSALAVDARRQSPAPADAT